MTEAMTAGRAGLMIGAKAGWPHCAYVGGGESEQEVEWSQAMKTQCLLLVTHFLHQESTS